MTDFADLEIRIRKLQDGGYPVELTLNHWRQFEPAGVLDPQKKPLEDWASPTKYGTELFNWLFDDPKLKEYWHEVRGGHGECRIRLRIDADAAEMHTVPWEFLHDGDKDRYLTAADATPFSRYLAGRWQPGSPILRRPIKILVAVADPINLAEYDLDPIKADEEWATIEGVTADLDVELIHLPQPCTLPALEDELRKGCYHILHFIGHGQLFKGEAWLYMADDNNEVERISERQLAEMLDRQLADADVKRDDNLRLVFLASCQTATRHPTEAFRGLAPALVNVGIPAVVAMQDLVEVETAQTFTHTFYEQLLIDGRVDLACNVARSALLTANLQGAAIPVLFMRLPDGRLLGYRGQILGQQAVTFWETLLRNINDQDCTPFLGPGVTTGLLPSSGELAEILASSFPFADKSNLARVAQFHDTFDKKRLRRDTVRALVTGFQQRLGLKPKPGDSLSQIVAEVKWSEHWQRALESEIHKELADLELPLYVTTNFDNFMTMALQERWPKANVRRISIPWHESTLSGRTQQQYSLEPPLSIDDPVILHLFGTDEDLLSMVLTEDDHLDFLARISSDHQHLLPTDITARLAETSLLFLGYRLEDLELKVILRGLLPNINLQKWAMMHVAVQLEPSVADKASHQEVVNYFRRYFSNSKIDVYWGSVHQFVTELHGHWQEYKHG